ncbi:hypothetical protein FOA52_003640 [Chlamydomonas sp. UWO 241]|nr:hypothetical protein FOA52_003640 [Chlamydomonas sp. UWO 241]
MPRSVWKGPYVAVSLLQDVIAFARRQPDWWSKGRFQGVAAPEVINTHARASVVLPDFLHCKFGVHNGKDYVRIEVAEPMIGHKLGEFSPTRKIPVHKVKSGTGSKKLNPKTGKA